MKLALALGLCALTPWFAAREPADAVRARVLDARTLEVVQGDHESVLTLAGLPVGARLHAAEAAPMMESGTVAAVVVEVEGAFEYRYLCRRQAGSWGTHAVGASLEESDGWWLTAPLFVESGEAYRIVDVHNPGGDSIELTLRRGAVRVRGAQVHMDEVLVVDDCPSQQSSGSTGWVHVLRAEGRSL